MARGIWVGVNHTARRVKKLCLGDASGRARRVKKVWIGVNGIARLVWQDFALPTYTGAFVLYGDEARGRIELLSSGTLTLSEGVYDLFAVGAGVGGSGGNTSSAYGGGGGGAGYAKPLKQQALVGSFSVMIGAGGQSGGRDGGASSFASLLTSEGGVGAIAGVAYQAYGGKGGSGGGGYNGGGGGTDGGDGAAGTGGNEHVSKYGGGGQGTTTRAFGESSNTLYSGGGAGNYGAKAPGGGGDSASAGIANTGGGGGGGICPRDDNGWIGQPGDGGTAGGSGLVIVRWGY